MGIIAGTNSVVVVNQVHYDPNFSSCTVVYVYSTPGYGGEKAAMTYAALLPSVPPPPDGIRKAWGHG